MPKRMARGARGEGDEWNLFFFFGCLGDKAFHSQTTRVGRRTLTFDSLVAGESETERRYTQELKLDL